MNLLSLLAGQTKSDPHAIIAIDADPDQPQHVSRAELWRRTLQLRADLATAGVGRGDGVLVALPAWSSTLEWYIAVASLGAYVVGVDPGDVGDPAALPDEFAEVLRRVRPKVVAMPYTGRDDVDSALRATLRRCTSHGGVPTVSVVTAPGRVPPVDPSPYDVGAGAWLPSAATVGMPMPAVTGDELAVAFLPDLAAHRESALTRHAQDLASALGLGDDDVVLCARPACDPMWLAFAFAAVASGGACLLEPTRTAQALLDDVARFGVTHLATDDEIAVALTELGPTGRKSKAVASWRWLGVTGHGDAVSDAVRRAQRVFGVNGTAMYGSAEVCSPATLWPIDAPLELRAQVGGTPVGAGVEVRIADPRTGLPLTPGERGEIQFRGHTVVDSYLDSPEALERRRTTDGWFRTGDAGSHDQRGGLRHTGRVVTDPDH